MENVRKFFEIVNEYPFTAFLIGLFILYLAAILAVWRQKD